MNPRAGRRASVFPRRPNCRDRGAFRDIRGFLLPCRFQILVISIASSVGALAWSMVLLYIIQLLASIFIAQVSHDFQMDEDASLETRSFVFRYFGNRTSAMLTMFEMSLAPGAGGEDRSSADPRSESVVLLLPLRLLLGRDLRDRARDLDDLSERDLAGSCG